MPPVIENQAPADYASLPAVLTTERFAAYFNRKPQTIHRWKKAKLIQPIQGTGSRLWNKDQILRRLAQKEPQHCY